MQILELRHAGGAAGAARVYAGALDRFGGQQVEALQRAGDADAIAVALYASPPYDVQIPAMAVSRLSINLSPSRVSGALDGERARTHLAARHSLFLTPAGAAAHWRKETPSRHINVYFDARAFGDFDPLLNGTLAGARGLLDALAEEMSESASFAAEAADSLARLILVRLARRHAAGRARANPLTPVLLARLEEFVASRLERGILVAELAAVAGLPVNRFAQAFVGATGTSPHQYVMARRLARAEALVRHSSAALADIAAATGFASQQHMTQLMRRRLGQTPARLRRLR
jgi:AraC family transcriptional regulator